MIFLFLKFIFKEIPLLVEKDADSLQTRLEVREKL